MNNIYKVIWSKAKNCYVVASEIARSHTKSASGSEKIGGVARHALLALGAACAIACGGFVNVGAVETVHVDESSTPLTAQEVYTKAAVDTTFATKTEVNTKADSTTVTEQGTKITQLETAVGNTYTKAEADGKFATSDALNTAKTALEGEINNLKAKDIDLEGKIKNNEGNIETNKNAIAATDKRTAGIKRDDVRHETTIEGNVTVDNLGNVKAKGDVTVEGKLKGAGLEAGAVNAGSLNVENASNLKGDVTMDNKLAVTGDTSLKKTDVDGTLNVTGESSLKDTQVNGTLTTTGKATFKEAVEMDKGLTVTNGDTTLKGTKVDGKLTVTDEADLKNTKVDGTLGVTGETKLDDKLTVKGEAKFEKNVTVDKDLTVTGKLNVGEISMKNDELDINGDQHDSTTTITADGISNNAKVTDRNGVTTESKFTHDKEGSTTYAKKGDATDWKEATSNVTADGVENIAKDSKDNNNTFTQTSTDTKNTLTDKEGNTSTTRQDSKGIYGYAKDKDGNKSYTKQEGNRIAESVIGQDGKETKSEMTSTDITNTAKDGTITSDAKDIVNKATGNISNSSATMDTTVTGKATESYGELETEVKGNEKHTVKGDQTNEVDGKQINTIKNGQGNIISGGQINNITGDQTTTVTGDISNTAKNITNEATTKLTDKVGANTRVLDGEGITDTVGGSTFKQRIDAIMGNVKTADGESEVTQKGDEITSVVGKGEATNSRVTQKKGSLEAGVTDGTNTNASYDVADASAKVLTGGTKVNKLQDNLDSSEKTITNGVYTTSKLQTALDITNTAKDGTITNDAKNIVNNATGDMTNTVGGKLTTTVTGQATENFKGGLKTDITGEEIHTVTGNQTNKVTGKQTNTVEGGQENIISGGQINNITGDQTTTISGTQTTTARDINRNASSGMIDTIDNAYGTNTETKVAGKTTTDVSIKGTGEKGQYIRGANESRDYLIKGTLKNSETKTAETTSTEITDGNGNISATIQDAKNLAGSVNNGTETGVSGIHANDDGSVSIDSIVTDGSTSSVINQKKDSIQSAVGDGNSSTVIRQDKDNVTIASSNGTVAIGGKDIINNAQDTITNTAGTKITDTAGDSTVTTENGKGTTFSKTGSTAYREGGPTDTNISGNTITTGKVTMDYAEVMKDLGVRGNANIAGKTTTGELEVTGKSTLKGDVTMESNATVKKDLTVEGTTTTKTLKVTENATVGGTLDVAKKATFQDAVDIAKDLSVGGNATIKGDVTAKSYKVGDKTYISADGINANDQKITNVADGSISEGSKDAVNGGQLYGMKRDLEHQVDKVGANAAAMANLHPMEFDPGSKWNIAAAMGNYGSETAAALGAFYRPNDDVMVNLSTAFGTGENMVGGGVSVRLGKGGNKLSREESNALKAQVADLTARMDALLSVLNPNMSKDFPDVPENHWAYEAVSRLAGNDIVQGYPDGEFHGERTMTRYEMAEIIYNALSRGAEAEKELVEEFKPELQAMAASEKATAERAEG